MDTVTNQVNLLAFFILRPGGLVMFMMRMMRMMMMTTCTLGLRQPPWFV